MSVRVIGITRPVIEECAESEQLLAYCARVSNAANQENHATGARLIRRLIRTEEWSPLEMVSATLEIETTRDIARQILRHRSFSFQEFSQRYAAVGTDPVYREARDQDLHDRQNSIEIDKPSAQRDWREAQERVWATSMQAYRAALGRGMAKEVARAVLPEGLTPSRLYMAGTLRSWVHYTALRSKPQTQKEHRLIAIACAEALQPHFPDVFARDHATVTGG